MSLRRNSGFTLEIGSQSAHNRRVTRTWIATHPTPTRTVFRHLHLLEWPLLSATD
jgi:hypothetical protein